MLLIAAFALVPEMDVPGHSYAWGYASQDYICQCSWRFSNCNNVALTPLHGTPEVVDDVFEDIASIFSDGFLHVGGDEIVTACFEADPDVVAWMKANGMTKGENVQQWWTGRILSGLKKMRQERNAIVWNEALNAGLLNSPLPLDVTVQVWDSDDLVADALEAGHKTINSFGFYLDKQVPAWNGSVHYEWVDTWQDFYGNNFSERACATMRTCPKDTDPVNLLGGETAMWSEMIDSHSIVSRVFPRAFAVAENLSAPAAYVNNVDVTTVTTRLNRFICHMKSRGFYGIDPRWSGLLYV